MPELQSRQIPTAAPFFEIEVQDLNKSAPWHLRHLAALHHFQAYMNLKRYQQTPDGHSLFRQEDCTSIMFVAFWKESSYLLARDRNGVKWLLDRSTSLRSIEKHAEGIVRIHNLRLIRKENAESCQYFPAKDGNAGYGIICVAGFYYRASLRYWNLLCRENGHNS